VGDKEVSVKER